MALPGWNQAAIDKADRYIAWCKAHGYDRRKFRTLCDQALERNDWRVVEMVYVRDEFETRQRCADDEAGEAAWELGNERSYDYSRDNPEVYDEVVRDDMAGRT